MPFEYGFKASSFVIADELAPTAQFMALYTFKSRAAISGIEQVDERFCDECPCVSTKNCIAFTSILRSMAIAAKSESGLLCVGMT